MRRYSFLTGAMVVGALLALVSLLSIPASANHPLPSSQSTAVPPSPPTDYLIVLSVPTLDPAEVPPDLTSEQAAEYARRLTDRQAGPVLAELERLRAGGLITGFEFRPDLHGVVVKGARPDALKVLSRRSGVAAAMRYSGDAPPVCAVANLCCEFYMPRAYLRRTRNAIIVRSARQASPPNVLARWNSSKK